MSHLRKSKQFRNAFYNLANRICYNLFDHSKQKQIFSCFRQHAIYFYDYYYYKNNISDSNTICSWNKYSVIYFVWSIKKIYTAIYSIINIFNQISFAILKDKIKENVNNLSNKCRLFLVMSFSRYSCKCNNLYYTICGK